MQKTLLTAVFIALGIIHSSNAATCEQVTCITYNDNTTNWSRQIPADLNSLNCGPTIQCLRHNGIGQIIRVGTCNSCTSGTRTLHNSGVSCDGGNEITYYSCDICTTTEWTAASTGYQSRKYCASSSDTGTVEYRCASGYYGTSSNGTSGCTQCPEATNIYTNSARTTRARGTSAAGTTSSANCYLPQGTYYDASGTFTISNTSCKY